MEQQDLNKRLLIALALSFLVFVGFSYLAPQEKKVQPAKQQIENKHSTPTISSNKVTPTSSISQAKQNINTTNSKLLSITSKKFNMSIDKFGRISQFKLLEKKYENDGKALDILNPKKVKPLEIRFSDAKLNEEAFKTPYIYSGQKVIDVSSGKKTVTLIQKLSSVTLTKKITIKPNGAYSIDVSTSLPKAYFITPGYRPMADSSRYLLVRGALVKGNDGVVTIIEDGKAKGDEVIKNAQYTTAFDRYVASIFYNFKDGLNVSILKDTDDNPLIFVEGKQNLHLGGYIGPKEYHTLNAINPKLTDNIEFGFFTFLSRPFYKVLLWIENLVGNWGWAIIIFTLLVKFILFPLSYKGMMSMQKLKDLAPKMKDIKEKYKDDPAKMNMKMMEMYKKHGANPMGGCLPMLLQIPVFFALYRVLLNADELQGASWIGGWIDNLAVADPYYILPILMGASMWFQQRITPNNFTDPLQEKIFKWFPVGMALMFIIMPFPSGLVLYWVVNNTFTIGQQYVINKAYAKHKATAIASHAKEKDS